MSSGSRLSFLSIRPARAACAGLGLLAIALPAAAALAAPAPRALTPRLFAVDYVSKVPPAIADSGVSYLASVYTPRTRTGAIHLHGGLFAPIDASVTNAMLGARIGLNLGDPLLFGVQGGWVYHTKSLYDTASTGVPGLSPKTVLATATAHLVPAMAFMQVTLTEKLPLLVPYVGIAAGYEWLILRAEDFRTDELFTRTYSNWAWEWYVGAGLKLSRSTRLDGEAFYNGGTLGRDVLDANNRLLRETVDMDGAGVRIGLHIVY